MTPEPDLKLCKKCLRMLPPEAFGKRGHSPCKQCENFRIATYYARHGKSSASRTKDRESKYRKYQEDPEYRKERVEKSRQYYQENRERVLESRKTHKVDPELRNARNRAYYQANREKIRARQKRNLLAQRMKNNGLATVCQPAGQERDGDH